VNWGDAVEVPQGAGLEHLCVCLDVQWRQRRHGVAGGVQVEVILLNKGDVDSKAKELADGLQLAAGDVEHLAVGAAGALTLLPAGQRLAVEVFVAPQAGAAPAL